MKLYRNAIILIIVLGLLIGAYFLVSNKKAATDTAQKTTTTENLNILSVDSTKVSGITIKSKDDLLEFTKNKTDWVLKSPSSLKTNKDLISTLMSGITTLSADKIIEKKATNTSQYGFDASLVEIVIATSDNKTQTLELGSKTPTQDGYYLLDKQSSKVFTISTYTADQFIGTRYQIKDKTLFTYKSEEANGVSMDRGGKLLFSAKQLADKGWALTAPIEINANAEGIGPIVEALSTLTINSFIEDNAADLDKYGLKNPKYILEVDTAKSKNRIILGNEQPGGTDLYAVLDGSSDVFTVPQTALTFLDKPFKEIVESFAYITNISDVTKIDVTMDGKTVTSTLATDKGNGKTEADKDKDKFTIDGIDASAKDADDNQPFRSYYQSLIGVLLDSIDIGAVPTGTPEITIDYTLNKAPGRMKVEFISKDKDFYYVVKNGKYSNILVQKSQFDKPEGVRESYKKLMDFLKKK